MYAKLREGWGGSGAAQGRFRSCSASGGAALCQPLMLGGGLGGRGGNCTGGGGGGCANSSRRRFLAESRTAAAWGGVPSMPRSKFRAAALEALRQRNAASGKPPCPWRLATAGTRRRFVAWGNRGLGPGLGGRGWVGQQRTARCAGSSGSGGGGFLGGARGGGGGGGDGGSAAAASRQCACSSGALLGPYSGC